MIKKIQLGTKYHDSKRKKSKQDNERITDHSLAKESDKSDMDSDNNGDNYGNNN